MRDVFHWLGYRHMRLHGEHQVVSRRHEGARPAIPPEVRALVSRAARA
jgi:hypothetical protein